MKKQTKTDGTSIDYGHCTAQHCANQAVGLCPCGMALCAACLARHARFLSADYLIRREQEDEEHQP